jgi:hypothetical protein
MIRNLVARFTVVTLPLVACGPATEPADTPNASAAVLADAKARAQDLANSTQNYQPVRFVSAIEQVRQPRPVRQHRVEEVVKPGTDTVQVEPVPMPTPSTEVAEQVVPVDSAPPPSTPRVPSIVPRQASLPEAVGGGVSGTATGDWRGADPGPDMGTVIGVVLRGGRGDPGHCPRHPRPPSQIPNRLPR